MPGQDRLRLKQLMDHLYHLRAIPTAVPLDEIPEIFRPDLLEFVTGETLTVREDGQVMVGPRLLHAWVHKVFYQKGFDYTIDLSTVQ